MVNPLLLLFPLLHRHLEAALSPVEADDVNQLMGSDVKHEGNESDERAPSFESIQDAVVLDADPVKIKAFQMLAAIQDLAVVLAEMCECAFVDLVLTEFGECLDIVPMDLPGIGDQPEIPARKLFSILKGVSGAGDLFRSEEHPRFTPRDERSVPRYSYD
jgi:hypothetical protein